MKIKVTDRRQFLDIAVTALRRLAFLALLIVTACIGKHRGADVSVDRLINASIWLWGTILATVLYRLVRELFAKRWGKPYPELPQTVAGLVILIACYVLAFIFAVVVYPLI